MKDKCTILVSSCDTYSDTWYPFFKIMKAEWPDRPWPIILNTESKTFDFEDMNIKTFSFYKEGEKPNWGERLIKHLKHIDTEYVMFLMDDFFLMGKVKQDILDQCISWMDEDKTITVFSYRETPGVNIEDTKYPNFELRPKKGDYIFNCQPAIWRRTDLIKCIMPHENPWQWEEIGSFRSYKQKGKFYSCKAGYYPYIYDFRGGGAVHRGKWTRNVAEILKKHNIDIDLSVRGVEEIDRKQVTQGLDNKTVYRKTLLKSVGPFMFLRINFPRLYKKIIKKIKKD